MQPKELNFIQATLVDSMIEDIVYEHIVRVNYFNNLFRQLKLKL